MSKTIDEKVVEMRFDNKDFESNVKTSMSTIEKLKRSLNFSKSADSLGEISSAASKVNMSGLSGAVDTVKAKFSALQVMAVTALANITNSAINAGKNLVSSLTIDQVTAGWSKYEQKTASVQTIMNATGKSIDEVNRYLDKLMWYSDETSYGFTDMTQSLGQLTSAGGDIENLIPMIEGIANATAYAGKGATEFSRAIYNLNQSYSAGHLQYMDWRSLELAGVASKQLKQVFIETAEAMGKIAEGEINVANFSETLKDKWADTEVMEAAFGKFAKVTEAAYEIVEDGSNKIDTATVAYKVLSGELDETSEEYKSMSEAHKALVGTFSDVEIAAAKSAQEAKTFSEAIEATKDAVSSGWMKTSEIIFGNYEEAKQVWSEFTEGLWDVFASGGEKRNELLAEAFNSKWSKFADTISDAGISVDDFQSKLGELCKSNNVDLDALISKYGSLDKAIASGEVPINLVKSAVKSLGDSLDDLSDSQLKSVGYTDDQIEKLRELSKQVGESGSEIDDLINSLAKPSGRDLFIDSFRNILGSIATIIQTVKDAWGEIFEVTPEGLYDVIEAFHDLSKSFVIGEKTAEKLKSSLKGVFAILDIVGSIAGSVVKTAFRVLGALFSETSGAVLDLTASIGDNIVEFRNWFKEHNIVAKALNKFGDILVDNLNKVKNWVKAFKQSEIVRSIISGISNALSSCVSTVREWIDAFNDLPVVKSAVEKVSTALSKLKTILSDISASKIVTFIGNCIAKVKEWIKAFLELPKVQKAIENVKTAFKDVYEGLKEYFGEGIEKIIEFIDRCKELDGLSLENAKQAFKDFYDNVFKYFFDTDAIKKNVSKLVSSLVDGFWELDEKAIGMKKAFKNFKWNIGGGIFDAGGKLEWVKTKFLELADLAEEKLPSLMGLASAAVLIKTLDKIGNALDLLATPIKSIKKALEGASVALETFAKGFAFKMKAEGIKDIAIAIAILAGSLSVLSQIPWRKLLKATLAIGALVVMLGGLSFAISKLGAMQNLKDVKDLAIASLSFLSVAGALIILAGALKIMETIDFNTAWKNAILLGGMAVALGAAIGVLNKLSGGKATKSALTMVGMAVAIKILVSALVDIDSINFNNLNKSLLSLAEIVAVLGALALACSFVKFGTGLGILGLVVGLKMFIGIFDDIADLDLDKVTANIDKFKMVFGMLSVLMLSMALAGKNAGQAGVGILAMSAGILLLTKAIKDIAGISSSDIEKGTTAISKLLLMFGVITVLSKFAGSNAAKAGRAMVTASVGILILAGAIHLLQGVDAADIKNATNAISQLLLCFAVLIASTKFIPKDGLSSIITLTIGVVALVAATALLTALDESDLKHATASLSIIMGMFSLLIATTKLINTEGKAWVKTAGVLIVLTAVVGALAIVLKSISDLPVESTLANAAGLSGLLLSISVAMAILSHVGEISLSTLGSLVAVTAVVAGLAVILYLIRDMPIESTLANAASLSMLILALSGACVLLSLVPATGATAGIVALLEVFGATGLVVLVASLLNLIPGIQEFMAGGFNLLKQFSSGLGEVIGSFVNGIGKGLTDGLADIADNLTNFMEHLQPFVDGAKSIEPGSMEGVKDLCNSILGISIASLINMFTGQSLEDFGTQLTAFGEAICGYSSAVSADGAINQESIDSSITAANKLVQLANTVPSSGLIPWIVGEQNLGTFATQLSNFGKAITEYSSAVSADGAINQEAISSSITAANKLVQLAKTVPDSGLIPWITGQKDLGNFGRQLKAFGKGIASYSESVSAEGAINNDAISTSITAANSLVELAKTVPDSGLIAWVTGEKSLGSFGSQLEKFGGGIASYGESVKNVDNDSIANSITAANRLVTLSNKVSELEIDSGKISDFKDDVKDIGEAIGDFTDNVSTDNDGSVTAAVSAVDSMVGIVNKISIVDTSNVENFKMALQELSTIDLQNFANSFGTAGQQSTSNLSTGLIEGIPSVTGAVASLFFSGSQTAYSSVGQFSNAGTLAGTGIGAGIGLSMPNVISATGSVIGGALQRIFSSNGQFTSSGTSSMTSLSGGIRSGNGSVMGATGNVIGGAIQSILSRGGQFTSSGSSSMNNLRGGISSGLSTVSSAASEVAQGAVNAADGHKSDFTSIGQNMMEGLKGGILDKAASIAEAAVSAVKGAINAAKEALGIASPSKVFAEMGRFTDQGYINGIVKLMPKVASAASSMAQSAIDGASTIVSNVGSIPLNSMDYQPTIHPVVDMNSINADHINLGANLDASMIRPINSLSQIVSDAQSDIDTSNQKVIDAVNGLRDDLNAIYNSEDKEIALYVDSKKLASTLAKPMNRQLNILSKRGAY